MAISNSPVQPYSSLDRDELRPRDLESGQFDIRRSIGDLSIASDEAISRSPEDFVLEEQNSDDHDWESDYEDDMVRIPMSRKSSKRTVRVPSFKAFPVSTIADKVDEDDEYLVTWTDDDPDHPHNWPSHRKWTSTILVALFAFIAPMASTMVAPSLDTIALEFNITSDLEKYFVMSIFLLAFAIGPFLWGPASEVFGRVRVMQVANTIFLLFNTVCGLARSRQQMMAFRFLAGVGGSAPQAIGGGILSDCFPASQRGLATAIYSLMPFLSPSLAPILAGYVTQAVGWRWVFWITSLFNVAVLALSVFLMRETHHPTILATRSKKIRKSTGEPRWRTRWQGPEYTLKKRIMKSCVRPFIMLFTQPALQAMSLYRGFGYGTMYLLFATFPLVFEQGYGQTKGQASLNYLSLGIGFVIGLQISGLMQDRIYTWCKARAIDPTSVQKTWMAWKQYRQGPVRTSQLPREMRRKPVPVRQYTQDGSLIDFSRGLPEYRLPLTLPASMLVPIGLFIYGWTAHYRVHWIAPNIGACLFSIGVIVSFNAAQGYVVDTYTTYAASATGAAAFIRTMMGFSFPLFAPQMFQSLGIGPGISVLAGISLTLGMVAPVLLWKYGVWLRSKSTYCVG